MDRMDQTYEEDYQPYNENGAALIGGGIDVKDYKPYVPSALAAENPDAAIGAVASMNHNNMDNKETNIFSYILLAVMISLSFIASIIVFNRKKRTYSK